MKNRKISTWMGVISLFGALFGWGVAQAVPVACVNDCLVSNGNVQLGQGGGAEHHLDRFSINGVNHLFSEEFHMDFGIEFPNNDGDQEINDMFALVSATADEDTDTMVSTWVDIQQQGLALEITQQLVSVGQNTATARETISYTNVGTFTINFWFVEYTDWDLNGLTEGQVAELTSPTTFTQTFPGQNVTATVTASLAPDHFGIAAGNGESALLIDPDFPHLNDVSGPVGPADVRHGFEYVVSLGVGESFTVSFEKVVTVIPNPVPTMGQWGLLMLAVLLGLAGFWQGRWRFQV